VDWTHLVQDTVKWLSVVNMALKRRVPFKMGDVLTV